MGFINVRDGESGAIGRMSPLVNLVTNEGTITDVREPNVASGELVMVNGNWVQPDLLFVQYSVATGVPFLFPNNPNDITFA